MSQITQTPGLTLVLGATGKTGRRIASRLEALNHPIRKGSRSASPSFDWTQQNSWDDCLEGVTSVYVNYPADLPIPGSADIIAAFVDKAVFHEVRHLVLLTGRGEPDAKAWETIVQHSGLDWTIVRSSWFQQNFSEGSFAEMVQEGQIVLPAGDTPEPFIDINDIADVVVAALTQPGHTGEIYEVTGPRLLTFEQAAAVLSQAAGRSIEYLQIPHEVFLDEVSASGAPEDVVWLLDYLFDQILDGRNAYVTDDVHRALGRGPREFSDFAREIAKTKIWSVTA